MATFGVFQLHSSNHAWCAHRQMKISSTWRIKGGRAKRRQSWSLLAHSVVRQKVSALLYSPENNSSAWADPSCDHEKKKDLLIIPALGLSQCIHQSLYVSLLPACSEKLHEETKPACHGLDQKFPTRVQGLYCIPHSNPPGWSSYWGRQKCLLNCITLFTIIFFSWVSQVVLRRPAGALPADPLPN